MKFTKCPKKANCRIFVIISGVIVLAVALLAAAHSMQLHIMADYVQLESVRVLDRQGRLISLEPNAKGNYATYINADNTGHTSNLPSSFVDQLIAQEDRLFYYHPGVNPWSLIGGVLNRIGIGSRTGSSTITQQVVKIVLGNETSRTPRNQIRELFYALALDLFQSKHTILTMYANLAYFGNTAQGIDEASRLYFGLSPELLDSDQVAQLLAALRAPNSANPAAAAATATDTTDVDERADIQRAMAAHQRARSQPVAFELGSLSTCTQTTTTLTTTIDTTLNERIRDIVTRTINGLAVKDVHNAAVVVLKLPENELLAMIGSPDPEQQSDGYQINMALQPRAIGSTIKPFIYLNAFEKGARPYTLVDDREYKYITALGLPLYPKNFDYQYRGLVTLHYALSNSLNVPAVKTLEFVGLERFYHFLQSDLWFEPIQDLHQYQLGIALGALEMKLYDLAWFMTIFPNQGVLRPVHIASCQNDTSGLTSHTSQAPDAPKRIADPQYIALVNAILNDRITGIEQFGLKSELNLYQHNYALKTGTSRDFRDSWVIGYTPDFLVGVWTGNADNSPMENVTGQQGAGLIWGQVMELMFGTPYNKKTPLQLDGLTRTNSNTATAGASVSVSVIDIGLPGDDYATARDIMLKQDDQSLILYPHDGDTFLLEPNTVISLRARTNSVQWLVNDKPLSTNEFRPTGSYTIEALGSGETGTQGERQSITIHIRD